MIYTQTVFVDIDGTEIVCQVDYTYIPGSPECGPSYSSGGEPAGSPEVEFDEVRLCGPGTSTMPAPDWFANAVINSEKVYSQLIDKHVSDEGSDYDVDAAYERKRDREMDR